MSTPLLPPALLDLTCQRVALRLNGFVATSRSLCAAHYRSLGLWRRYEHGAALLARPPPQHDHPGHVLSYNEQSRHVGHPRAYNEHQDTGLALVDEHQEYGGLSELEERISLLKETLNSEESLVEALTYSEDELLHVYEDLLTPPPAPESEKASIPEPHSQELASIAIVQDIAKRLLDSSNSGTAMSQNADEVRGTYHYLIEKLENVAKDLDAIRTSTSETTNLEGSMGAPMVVSSGILTNAEWSALLSACIYGNDGKAAENLLSLMTRLGSLNLQESITDVLVFYASAGDVTGTERVLSTYAPSPNEVQRDLHVKTHIKALSRDAFPTSPLSVLHAYEEKGTPAPQKSYTRAIVSLLATHAQPTQAHAQAWDLFAHMRYVAHPDPDAALYTLMLRACAHPAVPADPLRALDLWTEMTVDRQIRPSPLAYAAVAYAFSRSGDKKYISEAFRLAKEMLDSHRDARGHSAFVPDRRLFGALLEGAKRIGDLGRARWILAEMVRESTHSNAGQDNDIAQEPIINEAIMKHVFHSYASYRPPFKRSAAPLIGNKDKHSGPDPATPSSSSSSPFPDGQAPAASDPAEQHTWMTDKARSTGSDARDDFAAANLPAPSTQAHFSHIPPQTSAEVVAEAQILFNRILEESPSTPATHRESEGRDENDPARGPFRGVRLTPRLLNAYLTVHYAHSPLHVWSNLYRTLYDELGVARDAKTYVDALERCTIACSADRRMALSFAEEVWASWERVEEAWRRGEREENVVRTVDARLVERANASMIRMFSLNKNLSRALDHTRQFSERYPPSDLLRVSSKLPVRSSRIVLQGMRPLVRLTSATEVPDDGVPPLLTFTELEVLHHRLVAVGDRTGLAFVKWLCKSYEGGLRRRRDATMRAAPVESSSSS